MRSVRLQPDLRGPPEGRHWTLPVSHRPTVVGYLARARRRGAPRRPALSPACRWRSARLSTGRDPTPAPSRRGQARDRPARGRRRPARATARARAPSRRRYSRRRPPEKAEGQRPARSGRAPACCALSQVDRAPLRRCGRPRTDRRSGTSTGPAGDRARRCRGRADAGGLPEARSTGPDPAAERVPQRAGFCVRRTCSDFTSSGGVR